MFFEVGIWREDRGGDFERGRLREFGSERGRILEELGTGGTYEAIFAEGIFYDFYVDVAVGF